MWQAIQNQAEMDTIRKKLEVCFGEKEKLERYCSLTFFDINNFSMVDL
jgi:hypothetical protein